MKHYFDKSRVYNLPDVKGHYGDFGGKFVPETLMIALKELEEEFNKAKEDESFLTELYELLSSYSGRPTPLYEAKRLSQHYKKGTIYLKREDLNHTGAHKINNVLGQVLLAKKMGKTRIIAETGAGQHGVATATACALFDIPCEIFMGEEDTIRQKVNVDRMKLLGAKVTPVMSGTRTLKDACSEAIRDWVTNVKDTYYVLGTTAGPHPYPEMVRFFQSIIGNEAKDQLLGNTNRTPDYIVACVGGGSNAMGMFYSFLSTKAKLIGVEAAGKGLDTDEHCASLTKGKKGILHGAMEYVLQDDYGQIKEAYSISAGLDYPGVGPEHCYLKDSKRVKYESVTDKEAVDAFKLLTKLEGIVPAIETSHALAYLDKLMPKTSKGDIILVCLSGRGDKDVERLLEEIDLEEN